MKTGEIKMEKQLKPIKVGFKEIPAKLLSGFISTPHNPTQKFKLHNEFGSEETVELERKDRVQFYVCYGSNYEELISLDRNFVDFKASEDVTILKLATKFWLFGKRDVFYDAVVIGHSSKKFYYITDSLSLSKLLFKTDLLNYLLALFCFAMAIWAGYGLSQYFGNFYIGLVGGFIALFIWAWNAIQLNKILNKLLWEPLARNYEGQLRREISKIVNEILDSNKDK